jgi:hypothetical protein
MMINPRYSITEATRLESASKNVCNVLLGLGAGLLAFGLYMGFVRHANAALVFSLLGITTVVFAVVLWVLMKPDAFAFMSSARLARQPEGPVNPERESTVAQPHAAAEIQPQGPAVPRPEVVVNSPAEPAPQLPHPVAEGPQPRADEDLVKLMDTTLGDILHLLQSALRKDSEASGRH